MLWYKAWLETRTRFLISLCGIMALCTYFVFHGNRQALSDTKLDYYYSVLHAAHSLLAVMWVLAINLLMMGGLLREKAVGASSITLALPVSRARLMGVRISMGLMQALTLVILPWTAIFLLGATTGKTHSLYQATFHVVLLTGAGLLFFSIALLISSLVEGEYTAPIVSFGALMTIAVALSGGSLRTFSPWAFIVGTEYFDRHTSLLLGPIPWMQAALYVLFAVVLSAASVYSMQRREF